MSALIRSLAPLSIRIEDEPPGVPEMTESFALIGAAGFVAPRQTRSIVDRGACRSIAVLKSRLPEEVGVKRMSWAMHAMVADRPRLQTEPAVDSRDGGDYSAAVGWRESPIASMRASPSRLPTQAASSDGWRFVPV